MATSAPAELSQISEDIRKLQQITADLNTPTNRARGSASAWAGDVGEGALVKQHDRSFDWRQALGDYRLGTCGGDEGFMRPSGFYQDLVKATKGRKESDFEVRLTKALYGTKAIQGMSEEVGADGGFAVIPEYSAKIYDKVYANDLFQRTDNYTVGGNGMTFPRNAETSRANGQRAGGLQSYWLGEGAPITPSNPTLAQTQLRLKKLAVVVYLTNELIDDNGMALESYVTRKVSEELAFMTGDAIVEGTGVGMPTGWLSSGAAISVAKDSGQTAATITYANIQNMWQRMWRASRLNAVWYINQDCESQLHQMFIGIGLAGQPVYIPPGGASAAPYATLMGRPVIPIEFASTCGTVGDINLVDLKQYVSISKGGIAQAQSMHVQFLADQLALRFTMRVDGTTWENSPITPFKGTNTQSSFITLATRA